MRSTQKVATHKRKKRLLKRAKGFSTSRQQSRKARETLLKSGQAAYRGRKEKKRTFRRLWITRLGAALEPYGLNYSTFIKKMDVAKVKINRKVLSDIAIADPKAFDAIVTFIKK